MKIKEIAKQAFLILLLVLAGFFLTFGLYKLLGNPLPREDVTAYFSVAGLFLVSAGLLYQIKEYKMQVIELKKTVAAQEDSAKTLAAQKELLAQQVRDQQIFSMISSFRQFADRALVTHSMTLFTRRTCRRLGEGLIQLYRAKDTHNTKEFSANYGQLAVDILYRDTKSDIDFPTVRKFVQNVYNILHFIHQTHTGRNDWFTPFLLSNLSPDETLTVYLFSLMTDYRIPPTDRLSWHAPLTEELIERIADSSVPNKLLDPVQLTEKFNSLLWRNPS